MALRKLAKDGDSGKHGCPTVYVDEAVTVEGGAAVLGAAGRRRRRRRVLFRRGAPAEHPLPVAAG